MYYLHLEGPNSIFSVADLKTEGRVLTPTSFSDLPKSSSAEKLASVSAKLKLNLELLV